MLYCAPDANVVRCTEVALRVDSKCKYAATSCSYLTRSEPKNANSRSAGVGGLLSLRRWAVLGVVMC